MPKETFLGDGLYASFDGFSLWLRAPRIGGDHVVALEPQIMADFIRYAEQCGVIKRPEKTDG
jgi:hypothetical protein